MKYPLLFAAAVLLSATVARSQAVWKSDLSHSRVDFNVTHLVISEVTGRFTDFDVTLTQGNEDFTGSTIEAKIRTKSINTDNARRDSHLRTDDFLNAEKYPEIKFTSTSFEKIGEDTYNITGDLTIRDVTKRVVLDTKYKGFVKTPWGDERAGFVGTTVINRFDYGVKWNNAIESGGLVAGKDVTITLRAELVKQK
jgi:polyisoprenoid-binding protein YceI